MLKNYFKTSLRNLLKNKVYTIINILGLAIGLGCFILVTAYNKEELSYDAAYAKSPNIYRITTSLQVNGVSNHYPIAHYPAAQDMNEEYPEVKASLRLFCPSHWGGNIPKISYEEINFPENRFFIADSNFFDFFDFEFKYGSKSDALKEPFSVVLTEEIAGKYFGEINPVGKLISYNDSTSFKVTGVLKHIGFNTHLQFDFIANAQPIIKQSIIPNIDLDNAYIGLWYFAYVELQPGTNVGELENKLQDFVKRHYPPRYTDNHAFLTFQNLQDIHLKSSDMVANDISANGNIEYVYILTTVAIAVLLVACFNFVNLATSRYLSRSKEVGIRKAVGADRIQLIIQFISEATIITALAGILSVLLVALFIPSFDKLAGASLELRNVLSINGLISALVLFLIVGIASGIYPALILSNFQAAAVLKGLTITNPNKFNVRKGLVVLQFAVSMILIIGTLMVISQLDFLKNKNLGFDKEHVVFVQDSGIPIFQKFPTFKNKLLASSQISHVTYLSNDLGQQNLPYFPFKVEGREEEQMLPILRAGFDFTETFQLEMKEGRFFSIDHPSDSTNAFVINESAAKAMGWSDPIGKKITTGVNGSPDQHVIGVIRDFNFDPLRSPIGPLVISFSSAFGNVAIKLKGGDYQLTLNEIEKIWKEVYPEAPFSFYFLDEALKNTYQEEQRLAKIYFIFCCIAISLASLGLFALASYTIEKRKKEIALRKVMGATSTSIAVLINKEFMVLILMAFLVAIPISFLLISSWLDRFAYHVDISFWLFAASLTCVLVVSGLTVSLQTIKASLLNPASVLKND